MEDGKIKDVAKALRRLVATMENLNPLDLMYIERKYDISAWKYSCLAAELDALSKVRD